MPWLQQNLWGQRLVTDWPESQSLRIGDVRRGYSRQKNRAPAAKDLSIVEADEIWSYIASKNSPSGYGGQ